MDYEKKYREALERANIAYKDEDRHLKATLKRIFPELKESEDERIRKSIINLVIKSAQNGGMALHKWESQQMIAWLEKQGEDKPVDKIEPKFKVGDTIYYNSFGKVKSMIVSNVITDGTDNPMYEDANGDAVFEKDLVKQTLVWSEEDDTFFKAIVRGIENIKYISENVKKARYNWKPSDYQLEALESATENCAYSEYQDCLKELIVELKKLKGK